MSAAGDPPQAARTPRAWRAGRRPHSVATRLWGGLVAFVLLTAGAATLVYLGARHQDETVDGVVSYLYLHAYLGGASVRAITSGQQAVDRATAEAGVLALLAALLWLTAAVASIRNVTSPLRGLAGVLRRLAAGDHRARAMAAGPAEIQEAASSLNTVADESDRLREREAVSNRLRAIATQTGLRIRGNLLVQHARMYEAENRLVAELRAVDKAKSDFLATVSHELRTPLTSIAGYIEILHDRDAGPLTAAQEKMLGAVERNTARLRHLIEDVLTLSKIESGAFKTSRQPVNVADVVAAGVTALQPLAVGKGISVISAGAGRSLIVGGDPGQLDRLVIQVLSNAVKFTPDGGQVEVSVGSEGPMAVLSVRDTGIGIPEAEQTGLFTRFFRASNAVHQSIPGTGLGLTIVRTIVANHGGEMVVWSREDEGTTVTIRIPLLAAGDHRFLLPGVTVAGGGRPG